MGKLHVSVRDRIDRRFREVVFQRKGMKKGNLTEAVEEAMLLWIDSGAVTEDKKVAEHKKDE